ncbi:MAG: OmpA family protein [Polyangiaceae bacterium]|nr:OmpA family protein [Polyangiaceae bacterium]
MSGRTRASSTAEWKAPTGAKWWADRARIGGILLAAVAISQFAVVSGVSAQAEEQRAPARNGDGMDLHLFRSAVDSKGFFTLNGSDILGANDISFGLVMDYGKNLLRTADGTVPLTAAGEECEPGTSCVTTDLGSGTDAIVTDSYQGAFNFNYGIANFATVGLSLPFALMTTDPTYQIGATGDLYDTQQLDVQKLSTVALHAKIRITRVDKGVGLALVAQGGIPLADAAEDLAADPGAWYWPQIVAETRFGGTGGFKIGVNAGYRGHTATNRTSFGLKNDGSPQLAEGEFEYGNLATFSGGFAWRALEAMDLIAETYGTYLVDGNSAEKQKLSQEFVGGLKMFVEHNSYFMIGGGTRLMSTGFEAADYRLFFGIVFEPSIGDRDGDGYKDDEDQCPDEPEDFDNFRDDDGCPDPDNDNDGIPDVDDRCPNVPEDHDGDEDEDGCPEGSDGDRDGDGILDSRDKCPDDPEDRDGFEDKDGCPDPDNDKDGIPDVKDDCPLDPEDKDGFEDEDGCPDPDNDKDQILDVDDECPNDPEVYNGFEDEDGCPDKGKVIIEGSDIMILDKVQFETGSAEIRSSSFAILDAVSTTLNHHPEFLVIEVAGHADERSSDEYNLTLTQDRARSVVEAMISRGVERKRVVSQGYGEYCPMVDESNAVAWEKNRRVEFKVVKTEDGDTGVERGCAAARSKGVIPPTVE